MNLADLIKQNINEFSPMFRPELSVENTKAMSLSDPESEFDGASPASMNLASIDERIFDQIKSEGAIAGVGGYLERRSIYQNTELFQGDAERCIHIGVDVFMPAGTPIFAPLDGEVQSFANRQVTGDYGPVIILCHRLAGEVFHSLYGHLSVNSLDGLVDGRSFAQGEQIAEIGDRSVNGNWTPHLHFQLIKDMQNQQGDYPGVVCVGDLDFYRDNCPDPNILILAKSS